MPSEAERALLGTSYSQNTVRLVKIAIFGVLLFIVAAIILTVVYGVGEYKGAFIIVAISNAILLICTCFLMYWMEKGRLEDPVKFLTIAQAIAMVVLSASMIAVIYGPVAPATYALGGTSNSAASGITLQNSDGQSLRVGATGCSSFLFPNSIDAGSSYNIKIASAPSDYDCQLGGQPSGTVNGNILPVTLSCTAKAVTWVLGGTVNNLSQGGKTPLVLSDGKEELSISNTQGGSTTPFQFTVPLDDKSTYTVSVKTQPDGQTCIITQGASGTADKDISNSVQVTCA